MNVFLRFLLKRLPTGPGTKVVGFIPVFEFFTNCSVTDIHTADWILLVLFVFTVLCFHDFLLDGSRYNNVVKPVSITMCSLHALVNPGVLVACPVYPVYRFFHDHRDDHDPVNAGQKTPDRPAPRSSFPLATPLLSPKIPPIITTPGSILTIPLFDIKLTR